MSELNTDTPDRTPDEQQQFATNTPLMIALACALALIVLFMAVLTAEGQDVRRDETVVFGSLQGRVTQADSPDKGIAGVRVIAKRVHAGAANFYFDRVTSADGSFEFRYLLPGRYTIEFDNRTVPDAIFPAEPRLVIVDVTANTGAHAELAIARQTEAQDARLRKKTKD